MRNDSQMRIEGRAARLRVLCQRRVRGAHAYNFGSVLAAKVNVTAVLLYLPAATSTDPQQVASKGQR